MMSYVDGPLEIQTGQAVDAFTMMGRVPAAVLGNYLGKTIQRIFVTLKNVFWQT